MQETLVQFLGWEDPLEKGKTTHSSILAWRIPWTVVHGIHKELDTTKMVTAAMKLKQTLTPWKESYDQPRQHIKKQRHYFANKISSGQGYGFSSGHVWM